MKKGLIGFASAIVIAGLTGCAGNADNNAADNGNGNFQTQRVRTHTVNENNTNNISLRVADRAERSVERLDKVDEARVIISNNNAYVAVRLKDNDDRNRNTGNQAGTFNVQDDRGTGRNAGETTIQNNRNRTGTGYTHNNYVHNTGTGAETGRITGIGNNTNLGTDAGNTSRRGTGTANNGYVTGYDTGTNNGGTTGTNNNGNGTNRANIYKNGMAGQGSQIYSKVNTSLEQKIADRVREADKKIHKVYVSFSDDTFNTMNNYTNDIQNGRNRDGIIENFNNAVQRMFGR